MGLILPRTTYVKIIEHHLKYSDIASSGAFGGTSIRSLRELNLELKRI